MFFNVSSPIDVTRNIIRTEGIRGLYRGFIPTLARECPGYGCFFAGYEFTRSLLAKENEKKKDIGNHEFSVKLRCLSMKYLFR